MELTLFLFTQPADKKSQFTWEKLVAEMPIKHHLQSWPEFCKSHRGKTDYLEQNWS